MQHLIDRLLVGLALFASAVYAILALGPKSLRKSAAASIADIAARAGAMPGLRGPLLRFSLRLANKGQAGCGGCDSCGADAAADAQAAMPESRVPISEIGMRGQAKR
jgi:uncharacterized protein DUF6587